MMDKDKVLELIQNKDYDNALIYIENLIQEILQEKLNTVIGTEIIEDDLYFLVEKCIENIPEYYDILLRLKNIKFYYDGTVLEELYELVNIYEILKDDN